MEHKADIVFVIDASDSMKPCFEQLKNNIKYFVQPFTQLGFESVRLGLLAYQAGKAQESTGDWVYRHSFICGDEPEQMRVLYGDDEEAKERFFTKSEDGFVDVSTFCRRLDEIECTADENTPLALDCAADFPFSPLCDARRAIVLFTDEKLEDGVLKDGAVTKDGQYDLIGKIMDKIDTRHISLFLFAPTSDVVSEVIGETSRVTCYDVKDAHERKAGESSWDGLNFEKVLETIGKNISGSVIQTVREPEFEKAVFGQNEWSLEQWGQNPAGRIINLQPGEGQTLDTSVPIEWISATMHWDTPIDLDLHAFYLTKDGMQGHVFYVNKIDDVLALDHDAGVYDKLDTPEGNDETITSHSSFDNIQRILYATKIYAEKGCFSDYHGKVVVTTNNPKQKIINVDMVSRKRQDWCVIAMFDNTHASGPRLYNINEVIEDEPNVNDSRWLRSNKQ